MSKQAGRGRGASLWAGALLLLCLLMVPLPTSAQPVLGQGDTTDAIAVVIGNKSYRSTVPVDFAGNDAEAMRDYLVRSLGFREPNVVVLKDATRNELEDWFGPETEPQAGKLWLRARAGRSDVFVYYSGHGVPDLKTRQPFLLPSDGNPDRASSGYPVETLYRNLELIKQKVGPTRQVVVMLDACFTGETGRADGKGLLAVSAPGLVPIRPKTGSGIVKLVATSGTAPANWDGETKLGLFTSRFLMGAAGLALEPESTSEAGASRSGQVSWSQLQAYLLREVGEAAQRESRREQVPEIDAAPFSLPLRPPVPAISKAVESVRDESNWRRAQAENTRAAYERYAALCGQGGRVCAHREQAIEAAAGSYLQEQSAAQAQADEEHWQRASREGTYGAYRETCRPPCAYKAVAARYAPEPPKGATPSPAAVPAPPAPISVRPGNVLVKAPEQVAALPPVAPAPVVAPSPAANPRRQELIASCDRLTALQGDPDLPAGISGVAFDKIDVSAAIPACRAAVEAVQRPSSASPRLAGLSSTGADQAIVEERRMRAQLGRALDAGEQYSEAKALYEQAAALGSSRAMSGLGSLYNGGKGVAQDYTTARSWYEKAADKGEPAAMTNLGILYRDGKGVAQDYTAARRWYEKAADKGELNAMTHLGILYRDGQGVAQDYTTARSWFEKAADKGEPNAMLDLGMLYDNGQGVAQDYTTARRWFEKAADKGEPVAMNNLGVLYRDGQGVAQDYTTARRWFEIAAEKGYSGAMSSLGALYNNGQGVAQNYTTARSWFEKAADRGEPIAMRNLGILYEKGLGVAQSYTTARHWYEKAAAAGDTKAPKRLAELPAKERGAIKRR